MVETAGTGLQRALPASGARIVLEGACPPASGSGSIGDRVAPHGGVREDDRHPGAAGRGASGPQFPTLGFAESPCEREAETIAARARVLAGAGEPWALVVDRQGGLINPRDGDAAIRRMLQGVADEVVHEHGPARSPEPKRKGDASDPHG